MKPCFCFPRTAPRRLAQFRPWWCRQRGFFGFQGRVADRRAKTGRSDRTGRAPRRRLWACLTPACQRLRSGRSRCHPPARACSRSALRCECHPRINWAKITQRMMKKWWITEHKHAVPYPWGFLRKRSNRPEAFRSRQWLCLSSDVRTRIQRPERWW